MHWCRQVAPEGRIHPCCTRPPRSANGCQAQTRLVKSEKSEQRGTVPGPVAPFGAEAGGGYYPEIVKTLAEGVVGRGELAGELFEIPETSEKGELGGTGSPASPTGQAPLDKEGVSKTLAGTNGR